MGFNSRSWSAHCLLSRLLVGRGHRTFLIIMKKLGMALEADLSRRHFRMGLSLKGPPDQTESDHLIISFSPNSWLKRHRPQLKRRSETSVRYLFSIDRWHTSWSRIHYPCLQGRSVLGSPQDALQLIKESRCDATQASACRSAPVGITVVYMLPQNHSLSILASAWRCGCSSLKSQESDHMALSSSLQPGATPLVPLWLICLMYKTELGSWALGMWQGHRGYFS